MAVSRLGIVGSGQMGGGVAEVAGQAGLEVLIHDISEDLCRRGVENIGRNLDRMIKRGRFKPEERDRVLRRIKTTTELEDFREVDFVIEAVVENEDAKIALFQKLDKVCPPEIDFCLQHVVDFDHPHGRADQPRADRFIGMHFMNPVPAMKLVEIIRGLATSQETFEQTRTLAERLGKNTMTAEDFPGFIVNRVLLPMINEAIYTMYEGVGGVTDIDTAMKLGTNQPMGPLELADLIGLDTCLAIMEVMHRTFGDDKYRPCPLLKKYVDAGYLGRKAGRGFYMYTRTGRRNSAGGALTRDSQGKFAKNMRQGGRRRWRSKRSSSIDTSPGKAREVATKLRQVAGVSSAHAVTGPHDIIASGRSHDVSSLGELVVQKIQSVPGVNRSLTSIVAD